MSQRVVTLLGSLPSSRYQGLPPRLGAKTRKSLAEPAAGRSPPTHKSSLCQLLTNVSFAFAMKLFAELFVLCAFESVANAFVQAPRPFTLLTATHSQYHVMFSSPDGFVDSPVSPTATGKERSSNSEAAAVAAEDREVKELKRELESRLAALAEKEKMLEARLTSINRPTGIQSGASSRGTYGQPEKFSKAIDDTWMRSKPTLVQGGALRTWSFQDPAIRRVQVLMRSDGNPLFAAVELWQGPDNTPHILRVYMEDGAQSTFSAFVDTPNSPNTISIRNTGALEFPLYAVVKPDVEAGNDCLAALDRAGPRSEIIQGGSMRTYPFHPTVESVAVMLQTEGRPLDARIELMQGPNNEKQVLELYTEDGLDRPFYAVIQTPGSGNVLRVVNTASMEFPMRITVAPYE